MSKISDLNYSQHITLADNFKQKSEVLNTWRVGMNDFARIAGGQDSRRNILSPRAFLEFLAKIFTLGYVDFSKRSNEAGRNMMAHIESSSYIKNNDGSEIMNFVMNNPEGERADSSKVIIEISLSTTTTMGTRQGHTAIIFPQSDFLSFRYEGKSFERKDDSSLHLITNKVLACYQREANKEIARLLNIPQELNNPHDLNYSQVSCKNSVDSTITDLLEKPLNNALLAIRKEHLLLMPYMCNESISYLLGEKWTLKEIDALNALNNYLINNKKATDNEINDIKVNLSHILIDSLDDAKVNLTPVIGSILETFLKSPYINDVRMLDWCFNKSMQYFDDSAKIEHACSVINHINFRRDQSKVAETLFFNLDKEPYKNSPELQELIWKKLVVYVNDFNLSNREKTYLIQRIFNNVESLFNKVSVSILVNDIFMNDFFMKNTEMINWYFPRLLKSYEDEKIYFDKLGYNFNNKESNEEIMKNQPKDVIEEKLNNELKLRFRMMQTILKSEVNVSPFIDQQRLNTLNPPENLRIAIEKFGWKKKTITA